MKDSKLSRRNFLKSALVASSGVLVGRLVDPDRVGAGTVSTNSVEIDLSTYDELQADGGFKVIKEVQIGDLTDNLIIVRKSENEYLVFSSICRHKKCNVRYKGDRDLFVCPCHGSNYDMTGKVVKGPSTGNLPQYLAKVSGRKLVITAS